MPDKLTSIPPDFQANAPARRVWNLSAAQGKAVMCQAHVTAGLPREARQLIGKGMETLAYVFDCINHFHQQDCHCVAADRQGSEPLPYFFHFPHFPGLSE